MLVKNAIVLSIMISFIGGFMKNIQAMQQASPLKSRSKALVDYHRMLTPPFQACGMGQFECAYELIKNADRNELLTRNNAGWVPLHCLFLLDSDFLQADEQKNLLTIEQKNGLLKIYFFSIGDDRAYQLLFHEDNAGKTLWHYISCKGEPMFMETAVGVARKYAQNNPQEKDPVWRLIKHQERHSHFTQLHCAVVFNRIAVVRFLLNVAQKRKGELISAGKPYQSALEWAHLDNKPAMKELLIPYAEKSLLELLNIRYPSKFEYGD